MTMERPTQRTPAAKPTGTANRTAGSIGRWWTARFRDRDDSEHEQILVRVGIATVILVTLTAVALTGDPPPAIQSCVPLAIFLLAGAVLLLAHLVWSPAVNPLRRGVALVLDIGCLSVGMILGGELMTPLYPLFLWVIFGMGFRYGQRYLLMSATLGVAGFATVVMVSDYWRAQPLLSASLLAALLILPAYASMLLTKLTDALSRAEESSRAKSRFLGTMSHELRTPLNAIVGMSDLLEATRLTAEQRDMVVTVRTAGRILLDLIDDVLDVARIETGRMTPPQADFDLHATFAAVLRLQRLQAVEKGLELRLVLDPATPYCVAGTERWLKQILANLIGNAIKFTDRGHVTMRVVVEGRDSDHVDLRIDVEDTGIGIPEDARQRIFERFVQADDSTSRRYGGSGLGLSIARQLAEIMGGSLTVDSVRGEGACFSLRISLKTLVDREPRLSGRVAIFGDPKCAEDYGRRLRRWGAETTLAFQPSDIFDYLTDVDQRRAVLVLDNVAAPIDASLNRDLAAWFRGVALNQVLVDDGDHREASGYIATLAPDAPDDRLFNIMHAALAVPPSSAEGRRKPAGSGRRRIIVAEDNAINRRVIEKMLLSGGHSVVVVEDGEQMLDMLEQRRFDLALVDLNMPSMSGLEAVKLHRMGVGSDHPPFVALTADATEETRQTCIDAGFADHLTKPVDTQDVLNMVDRLTSIGVQPADRPDDDEKVVLHPKFVDARSTVDIGQLVRLRALDQDPAFFVTVIHDFIEDSAGLIAELEAAAAAANDVVFRDRAHALHSSAAHIGATGLSRLCQRWHGIGPDHLRDHGETAMAELRVEFERLRAELTTLVDRQSEFAFEKEP